MTIVDSTSSVSLQPEDYGNSRADHASDHESFDYDSAIRLESANNFRKFYFAGEEYRQCRADLRHRSILPGIAEVRGLHFPRTFRYETFSGRMAAEMRKYRRCSKP